MICSVAFRVHPRLANVQMKNNRRQSFQTLVGDEAGGIVGGGHERPPAQLQRTSHQRSWERHKSSVLDPRPAQVQSARSERGRQNLQAAMRDL